jgi:hypothetical protein
MLTPVICASMLMHIAMSVRCRCLFSVIAKGLLEAPTCSCEMASRMTCTSWFRSSEFDDKPLSRAKDLTAPS